MSARVLKKKHYHKIYVSLWFVSTNDSSLQTPLMRWCHRSWVPAICRAWTWASADVAATRNLEIDLWLAVESKTWEFLRFCDFMGMYWASNQDMIDIMKIYWDRIDILIYVWWFHWDLMICSWYWMGYTIKNLIDRYIWWCHCDFNEILVG